MDRSPGWLQNGDVELGRLREGKRWHIRNLIQDALIE